jgi:succinate dehydrogenase/fumarate reductase flavoprotein subunit
MMEADVVVIGSGAAGLCAAIVAHDQGLRTLVLEKTPFVGGTTAISGGAVWAPMNSLMAEVQQTDSPGEVAEYLAATAGPFAETPLMQAYLRRAREMVDYLQRHTRVRFAPRVLFPDYYPVPGASIGARSLDPLPFDASTLGDDFRLLRAPRPEFMLFGGMMVNRADIVHLFKARRSFRSMKHVAKLLLRHGRDRIRYHRGTRLVFGNALAGGLFKSARDRDIEIWRSARAVRLVIDQGRVTGVVVERDGAARAIVARRGVVLASGGFPGNADMRARYFPHAPNHHTVAPKGNMGDGARLAESAGGHLGASIVDEAFWTPVSLLRLPDGTVDTFPHLVTERPKPGSIVVDGAGRRFVDETCNYHEFVRAMHAAPNAVPCFLICNAAFVDRYGLGFIRPWPLPRRHLLKAGYVERARTLPQLADKLGIDADALAKTVERFDRHARSGEDPDFGRGTNPYSRNLGDPDVHPNPCVGPVGAGPYYALRIYPGSIGTARGVETDGDARVLDAEGKPVPGLYACGNDMHSVMGGTYPGPGITLGPALTFGYSAGMHIAKGGMNEASRATITAPKAFVSE